MTWRPPKGWCARGLRHHQRPYSLARPLRTNHPAVLNLLLDAPNSLAFVSRTSQGIPLIPDPDLGNGIIPVPSPITVFTLPDEFKRGYIRSWNVAVQKELKWGFVGEAAYVGTRQIDQLGFRELNWSPIGGGQAGRQLNQQFGRTGQTRLIAPIGDSQYDALQTRLDRRFANGFQLGVNYTLSKSTGVLAPEQRQRAADQHPRVLRPEQVAQRLRSDAQPAHHQHRGAAVRSGPAVGERRRRAVADRRRMAGEQHPQLLQRHAVQRHGVWHVAQRAGERSARRPGRGGCADPRRHRRDKRRTSIRWPSCP